MAAWEGRRGPVAFSWPNLGTQLAGTADLLPTSLFQGGPWARAPEGEAVRSRKAPWGARVLTAKVKDNPQNKLQGGGVDLTSFTWALRPPGEPPVLGDPGLTPHGSSGPSESGSAWCCRPERTGHPCGTVQGAEMQACIWSGPGAGAVCRLQPRVQLSPGRPVPSASTPGPGAGAGSRTGLALDRVLRLPLALQPSQACPGRAGERPEGRILSCECQAGPCLFLCLGFGWFLVFLSGKPRATR